MYSEKLKDAQRIAQGKRHIRPLVHLTLNIDPDKLVAIEDIAVSENLTRSEVIRNLLDLGLTQHKRFGELSE